MSAISNPTALLTNPTPPITASVPIEITNALTSLAATVKALTDEVTILRSASQPRQGLPVRVPSIRTGEDPLSSRGYSFLRFLGLQCGILKQSECKIEIDVHNRLQALMTDQGYEKAETNTLLCPFNTEAISDAGADQNIIKELRGLLQAGVTGYDYEELMNLRIKYWGRQKALSWLDESSGGALVAPPTMGELISLLRNNEALTSAGARMIAMPPSGRITYPRQTSAMTAYWVGQSQTIPDSKPGTGDVTLTAKKLGILCKIPNELFRFPSISIEQFIREDMAKVMALRMDKSLLEAPGSTVEPKGLLSYANISKVRASVTDNANGDTFQPEDVATMIGTVEEQNAEFKSWIMRPMMYGKIVNRRADAVTANDHKGMFLFNVLRDAAQFMNRGRGMGNLEGYPVVKSTQVSNARSSFNGGTPGPLSYILGGDFSDYVIASSGVIEFIVAREGDTMVVNDQSWIRGIHYIDGAVMREASFAVCDNLQIA